MSTNETVFGRRYHGGGGDVATVVFLRARDAQKPDIGAAAWKHSSGSKIRARSRRGGAVVPPTSQGPCDEISKTKTDHEERRFRSLQHFTRRHRPRQRPIAVQNMVGYPPMSESRPLLRSVISRCGMEFAFFADAPIVFDRPRASRCRTSSIHPHTSTRSHRFKTYTNKPQ